MSGHGSAPSRRVLAALAWALVSVFLAHPAGAGTEINVTERYYDIEGSDVATLRAQMAALGPFSSSAAGHVPARMESEVDFRFVSQWRGGTCHVELIRVRADITYHYPRWLGGQGADVDLAAKWTIYVTNLARHEQGHGQIVIDAVHGVEAELAATPPSRDCAALRVAARERGAQILRRAQAAQIQYDLDTVGGWAQGAVLRPRDGAI